MNLPSPQPPGGPAQWVTRPDQLRRMISDLLQHEMLAVDTESNSLYVYQEQVCLVQFSTGKTDYIVDPLILHDYLPALGQIFADPDIEKIFHAAEYDIICLKRDFGFTFNNIFDTMVAGRVLGRTAIGLAAMLEEEFGIQLDKRFQRANWGERPLSSALLAYARLDTYYLIDLRQRLHAALQESGRLGLAQEDFQRLCLTEIPEPNYNDLWTRVAGGKELNPRQAAILEELCRYRDRRAQEADVPAFKIMSNKVLTEIAMLCPRTLEDLRLVKDLSPRLINRHGEALLQAVQRGLSSKPLRRPPNHTRPDDFTLNRLERLRDWRKQTGRSMGVESDVILPRDMMERLAEGRPSGFDDLADLMRDLPWRLEHFGPELLKILSK